MKINGVLRFPRINKCKFFPKGLLLRTLFLSLVLLLTGCGSSDGGQKNTEPPVCQPLRVFEPEAPGKKVLGEQPLTLDISCMEQGYFTAQAAEGSGKLNVQLACPDSTVYSYFLEEGEDAVIPFSGGNGKYMVICYQQISGSRYAALYSESMEVTLENEFLPFLYPNQYVDFTPETRACRLALEMMPEDTEDVEALAAIYRYVTEHLTYDEEKAATVEAGYLPDVDETLATGKGICFDYAALTTAMLRSRDIPCRLQIGYAGTIKHAWIDVYIRSKGWINKAVEFSGESWSRMDPTFDSASEDKEAIQSYIGNGDNYTVQFTR